MDEGKRIAKLFSDWYNGNPWTYVKMTDIIKDVSAEQAAKKLLPNANTIWQLVQHCLGWRENVLLKIQGQEFKSPEDNYLGEPTDVSDNAWKEMLARYEQNEKNWEEYLNRVSDDELKEPYRPSKNEFTNYEVIHGLLHHDNYHFGQVLMLKKML